MKKIICSIALIAGSLLSTGIFISCGDQFPEEYPWMIGRQEEMDNTNEEGAGATDITVLEKELRGAIPFMINYSHEPGGNLMTINMVVLIILITIPGIGLLQKVLLHLEGRYLLYIRILMTIWVVQIAIKFSHNR